MISLDCISKVSNIKKINIVGAGPGGLTAAMLLAKRGFKVTLFEKENKVGGRNAALVRSLMYLDGMVFRCNPNAVLMEDMKSFIDDFERFI